MYALPDLFSVKGRTALVTGGATGLGRVAAAALLSAGARVLIASRKAEACAEAAAELSSLGPCEGFGGTVESGGVREFGRAYAEVVEDSALFAGVWQKGAREQVWMSHGDALTRLSQRRRPGATVFGVYARCAAGARLRVGDTARMELAF